MAKHWVQFSCGHEATVQLFGSYRDRERKIRWYEESGLCPDCYREHKRAEEARLRAEEEKRLQEARQKVGMPELELAELEGTPKQVAWAEDIRRDKMSLLDGYLTSRWYRTSPLGRQVFLEARQELAGQASAKWWIENRHKSDIELLKGTEAYQQAKQNQR